MLNNVSSLEEVRRVLLHKKSVVTQLHLHWSVTSRISTTCTTLRPHVTPKDLQILGYVEVNYYTTS